MSMNSLILDFVDQLPGVPQPVTGHAHSMFTGGPSQVCMDLFLILSSIFAPLLRKCNLCSCLISWDISF